MKTKAVRLYGKNDLRLEEFELPEIKEDEILAKVVSDSICMSTYKTVLQGSEHKRVPDGIDKNPIIIGHEFSGDLIKVGSKWKDKFKEGSKFAVQPDYIYNGKVMSPGYSYKYFGGDATYIIIPNEVMEVGCLLNYSGESYYNASLAEPMSCIIGGFHSNYHTKRGIYEHNMGILEGGKMALLASTGPMGLGAIEYILNCDRRPSLIVITDINEDRIERAKKIFSIEKAKEKGMELVFVNTKDIDDVPKYLMDISKGTGYDDVYVYAPIKEVVEQADKILNTDGCLNFFAGPIDKSFSANFNFYNVHYSSSHVVGNSGGSVNDMVECLKMNEKKIINSAVMVTHIGGLNSVKDAVLNLPKLPGGKKMIYTNIDLELTAIEDFEEKGKVNQLFARLDEIVKENGGIWCTDAEKYLLSHFNR